MDHGLTQADRGQRQTDAYRRVAPGVSGTPPIWATICAVPLARCGPRW
jgi:hypothetical protein